MRGKPVFAAALLCACGSLIFTSAANAGGSGKEGVAGPVFSNTGPDASLYGAAEGFQVGTRTTSNKVSNLVGTYSHFDELFPTRPVRRAAVPWLFKRAAEPTISYSFNSNALSIEDYIGRHPTTGLLIVK